MKIGEEFATVEIRFQVKSIVSAWKKFFQKISLNGNVYVKVSSFQFIFDWVHYEKNKCWIFINTLKGFMKKIKRFDCECKSNYAFIFWGHAQFEHKWHF